MAEIFMAGILLAAVFWDWKTKKIPNWLNGLGILPVAWILARHGSVGEVVSSLLSMAVVFVICWNIYLLGGIGAGDCKLLILLAGVCGLLKLVYITVIAFSLACLSVLISFFLSPDTAFSKKILVHIVPNLPGAECKAVWGRKRKKHTVILAPFLAVGYTLVMFGRW